MSAQVVIRDVVPDARTPARSAAIDLGLLAGSYAAAWLIAQWLGIARAGSIAVLASLAVATWRLQAGGQNWRALGVGWPRSWPRVAAHVTALYVVTVVATLLATNWLASVFGWSALQLDTYAHLTGDLRALMVMLLLVWTAAALGEELLFRGFVLTRLELLLGGRSSATAAAVVLQAMIFGVLHAYLGPRGMVSAAIVGLVFGTWYVRSGRNLWSLIIAHGLIDSISLIAIHAGLVNT